MKNRSWILSQKLFCRYYLQSSVVNFLQKSGKDFLKNRVSSHKFFCMFFFQRGLRDFFFNRFPSTIFFYNFLLLYRFIAKISSKVVDRFSLRNFLWGFLLGFSGQTQIEKQSANLPSRIICESVFEGKSVYQFWEKIFERTFERKSSNQFLDENLRINFWEKTFKKNE